MRFGADEPCDLTIGRNAIDTKYRIGSGDSGTLRKLKAYGSKLIEEGYSPVMLIVRTDNLPAATAALRAGRWNVLTGEATYSYIRDATGVDIMGYLHSKGHEHMVVRDGGGGR